MLKSPTYNPFAITPTQQYLCNICGDDFPIEKVITLKCNPTHTYCYTCIFDWYVKNKHDEANRMKCPICRNDGGFLPCPEGNISIEWVHVASAISKISSYKYQCECMTVSANQSLHPCYHYASYSIEYEKNTTRIKACNKHHQLYLKGEDLIDKDYKKIESIYKKHPCKVKNCDGNANPNKNGILFKIEYQGTTYPVCKKHHTMYDENKPLSLSNAIVAHKDPESMKGLCGTILKNGNLCKHKSVIHGKCKLHAPKENISMMTPCSTIELNVKQELWDILYLQMEEFTKDLRAKFDEVKHEKHCDQLKSMICQIQNTLSQYESEKSGQQMAILSKFNEELDKMKSIVQNIQSEMSSSSTSTPSLPNQIGNGNEKPEILKKEITFDLFNYSFDPHCNVRLKNGKLCKSSASPYYNLKCGNHHSSEYAKEIFFKPKNK